MMVVRWLVGGGSEESAIRDLWRLNVQELVCLNEVSGGEGGNRFLMCLVGHREEDVMRGRNRFWWKMMSSMWDN